MSAVPLIILVTDQQNLWKQYFLLTALLPATSLACRPSVCQLLWLLTGLGTTDELKISGEFTVDGGCGDGCFVGDFWGQHFGACLLSSSLAGGSYG